jgi:hypothetical protein
MRTGDDDAPKAKPGKASQPVKDAPSGAIVLAGGSVVLSPEPTPQNGKAPDVIVINPTPINAASLGSDAAPVMTALAIVAKKSRAREYREAVASTVDYVPADRLNAWVDDAPAVDVPCDRAPWG